MREEKPIYIHSECIPVGRLFSRKYYLSGICGAPGDIYFEEEHAVPDGENEMLAYYDPIDEKVARGTYERITQEACIRPGRPLAFRNVLMWELANLLDVGSLVPKAEYGINNCGKPGVYMEAIHAEDPYEFKMQGHRFQQFCNIEMYDTVTAKIELSNLAFLDFISGNADRHVINMLFKFGKETEYRLEHVYGIDHDFTFGELGTLNTEYLDEAWEGIKYINKDLYKKITALSPDSIAKLFLDKGLSQTEAEALRYRIETVQKRTDTLCVFEEKDWSNHSIYEMAENMHIFKRVEILQKTVLECSNKR